MIYLTIRIISYLGFFSKNKKRKLVSNSENNFRFINFKRATIKLYFPYFLDSFYFYLEILPDLDSN